MTDRPHVLPRPPAPREPEDWKPLDLGPYVRGEITREPPTQLVRSDGVPLLYNGKVHWISGEPESGKSWLAILAVAERLRAGEPVLYLDFETDPIDLVGRLLALNVPGDAITRHLAYIRPYSPLDDNTASHAIEASLNVKLAVLDGVNASMGSSGFDPNNARDFYTWWELLGLQLQKSLAGAPIVAIDHVVKSEKDRGAYASGTGQKLAVVDVHFGVEKIKPFGIGLSGRSRIVIHKDKPAGLRQHAEGSTIAELAINSDGFTLAAFIDPAASNKGEDGDFRPTNLMEKVSRFVEDAIEPPTQRGIRSSVTGKDGAIVVAINTLAKEGYLDTGTGSRNATLYRSLKPFRDNGFPSGSPLVPTGSREPVKLSGSRFPTPIQGEPVQNHSNGTRNQSSGSPAREGKQISRKRCPDNHVCSVPFDPNDAGRWNCCGHPVAEEDT